MLQNEQEVEAIHKLISMCLLKINDEVMPRGGWSTDFVDNLDLDVLNWLIGEFRYSQPGVENTIRIIHEDDGSEIEVSVDPLACLVPKDLQKRS